MRNRLSLIPLTCALVLTFAGAPASAQAADSAAIIADCNDGTVDGSFSAKELQDTLKRLDALAGDYSECSDAIYRAQTGGGNGTGTGGGSNGSSGSSTGSGGSTGSGSGGGAVAPGGTATTPGVGESGTSGGAPAAPDPQNDARDADVAEKAAALAAATASADKKAGEKAAELKNTGIPAAALEYGGTDTSLPGPLLLTLVACVLAACLAGGVTGVQALRRRRGR